VPRLHWVSESGRADSLYSKVILFVPSELRCASYVVGFYLYSVNCDPGTGITAMSALECDYGILSSLPTSFPVWPDVCQPDRAASQMGSDQVRNKGLEKEQTCWGQIRIGVTPCCPIEEGRGRRALPREPWSRCGSLDPFKLLLHGLLNQKSVDRLPSRCASRVSEFALNQYRL
jgi:hypothetical protein